MKHFCTLFDKNYLVRGLVMYRSLKRHLSEPFQLDILALDQETVSILDGFEWWRENDESFSVQPLSNFEESFGLREVRGTRTWQEYAWTLASQFLEYSLSAGYPATTYLDADLMFFSDPKVIFDEIGEKDIAIIPHRFAPQHKARLEKNGKFNVSWVTARNTPVGRECIGLWAKQCRDWCYYRHEDGKFADQKYLDEWPELYKGHMHEIQNSGAGLAPWNLGWYRVGSGPTVNVDYPGIGAYERNEVIFYHFHEYSHRKRLTNYPLSPEAERWIYKPYIEQYEAIQQELAKVNA